MNKFAAIVIPIALFVWFVIIPLAEMIEPVK